MKKLIDWLFPVVLGLAAAGNAQGAYFGTLLQDPTHPRISATLLYTPSFSLDGGSSDVAVVYHKADVNETWMPAALLNLGLTPIAWTLLELGAGGNRQTGFATAGTGVDLAQTLLGPFAALLRSAGGKAATAADLLVSPNGSGLKLSVGWKANVLQDGGFLRFNELRFPPRYGIGYSYFL